MKGLFQALLPMGNNLINQPVLFSLLSSHDPIALDIVFNLVNRLAAVLRKKLACKLAHAHDLFGVNPYVGSLSRNTADRWLVDQDARVRQSVALARSAGRKQQRTHR